MSKASEARRVRRTEKAVEAAKRRAARLAARKDARGQLAEETRAEFDERRRRVSVAAVIAGQLRSDDKAIRDAFSPRWFDHGERR